MGNSPSNSDDEDEKEPREVWKFIVYLNFYLFEIIAKKSHDTTRNFFVRQIKFHSFMIRVALSVF